MLIGLLLGIILFGAALYSGERNALWVPVLVMAAAGIVELIG